MHEVRTAQVSVLNGNMSQTKKKKNIRPLMIRL